MGTGRRKILIFILVAVLIGLLVWCVVWTISGNRKDTDVATEIKIDTPYATLLYPAEWEKQLRVEKMEGEPYVVAFYGAVDGYGEQHLFDVCFGNTDGEVVGVLKTKDETMVNVTVAVDPIESDEGIPNEVSDTFFAMQEDLNFLLDKMNLLSPVPDEGVDDDVSRPLEPDRIEHDAVLIQTPYVQLSYPGEWEQYLRVEHQETDSYTVGFYAVIPDRPEQYLATLSFGPVDEQTRNVMTTEDGTDVGVTMTYGLLDLEGWETTQENIVWAMQEACNDLLFQISMKEVQEETEQENTVQQETNPEIQGDLLVQTPYVELKYPGQWQDRCRVEHSSKDVYTVSFYGKAGGKECLLFKVYFGDDQGTMLGMLSDPAGDTVPVSVIFGNQEFGTGWTDAAITEIYAMQEDVNYLIQALPLLPVADE